ncbi:MAG: polysaccharide deacetylase family protein [Lachnospiraceae bacterium]|nr:polysaccharide deacetylase family protein [Lachnospiraceae bacterium]
MRSYKDNKGSNIAIKIIAGIFIVLLAATAVLAFAKYRSERVNNEAKTQKEQVKETPTPAKEEAKATKEPEASPEATATLEPSPEVSASPEANVGSDEELTAEEIKDRDTETGKVYLTFDDGPGENTNEILDLLKEHNVKATFFVIAQDSGKYDDEYRRIFEEGHTIGIHSYTHDYDQIYASLDSFKEDVTKMSDYIYNLTGYRTLFYRFPGGSGNTVCNVPMADCIKYLNENNYSYYDWNAENGDATGEKLTPDQMVERVMSEVRNNRNSTVLMHDTISKRTTLESLPKLLTQLEDEGYVMLPLTKFSKKVQQVKAETVN